MIPHCRPELGGAGDPKLGATTQDDGMVVEHGGHDQGAVQDGGEEDGVLELGDLVAEPAVWGEPEKSLAAEGEAALGGSSSVEGSGGGREQGAEDIGGGGEAKGKEEGEEDEKGNREEEEGLVSWASLPPSTHLSRSILPPP